MTKRTQLDAAGTPDLSGRNTASLTGCGINPAFQATTLPRLICLLLAVVTVLVYLPVQHHSFVSYDDPLYVTGNRPVQAGLTWAGAKWAFTTGHASNWHPLTWLSHMLDVQLFGASPAGPHMVNMFIHAANTVLLFIVLRRLTSALWRSALVAALFALHPLHVESVAWVAERKDVLSAFFFLLTLLMYARYVDGNPRSSTPDSQPSTPLALDPRLLGPAKRREDGSTLDYCSALLFFALGLMSKPMLVTLPFVLLLLDYWPLRRLAISDWRLGIRHRIREKVPFFLLSALSCVVTFVMQRKNGDVQSLTKFPVSERIGNALVSYARYLGKTFWPADLAVFYPHPGHWPVAQVVFAAILVAGLCLGALWFGRRIPFAAMGWFWFLGMLVPAIGLVQVGSQSMADRYTYLPLIGIFIILSWGAAEVLARWRLPKAVIGIMAGLAVVACAVRTEGQLRHWQDGESLFRYALAVTKGNFVAHNNLGNALMHEGRVDEAIAHYQKALAIQPDYDLAHNNLGFALFQKGELDEAIAHFQKALVIQPDLVAAHYQLGNALLQKGRVNEAVVHYQKALEIQPDFADGHVNLANALLQKKQVREALAHCRAALKFQPDNPEILSDLAWVLATWPDASVRNGTEAIQLAQRAIQLTGGRDPMTLRALATAYAEAGQFGKAVSTARRALELAESHSNAALADTLRSDIKLYQADSPFRDTVQAPPHAN
jgi:tetratricopeptide (TPR) repeat protein